MRIKVLMQGHGPKKPVYVTELGWSAPSLWVGASYPLQWPAEAGVRGLCQPDPAPLGGEGMHPECQGPEGLRPLVYIPRGVLG